MIVGDNTIPGDVLSNFFKNLSEKGPNVSKTMTKNTIKNPSRALEIGANVGSEFASQSLYLGKFV